VNPGLPFGFTFGFTFWKKGLPLGLPFGFTLFLGLRLGLPFFWVYLFFGFTFFLGLPFFWVYLFFGFTFFLGLPFGFTFRTIRRIGFYSDMIICPYGGFFRRHPTDISSTKVQSSSIHIIAICQRFFSIGRGTQKPRERRFGFFF
jgi:hypothetical protein